MFLGFFRKATHCLETATYEFTRLGNIMLALTR